MFTNMNTGRTQTMTGHVLWLSSGNPVSQIFSFSGGAGWLLWFVCVLVMIAAGGAGSDYCSQTRSINKAKVPLKFKLKNYNTVFE